MGFRFHVNVCKFMQTLALTALTLLSMGTARTAYAATLPQGFIQEEFGGAWVEAVGTTFATDGTLFGWERRGMVFMYRNNQWHISIDIRDEVGGWRDFGLLGVALHPNFLSNGHIYLFYVVDRHHLLHAGTPQYNPNSNDYFSATIGRITRYTLDPSNGFQTLVPDSRVVLLGESIDTGIPILHESHGVGSLVFGTDGTLLASCGDGASFLGPDFGGPPAGAYTIQALADGIIRPKEDVGAFRSQLVDSLSGKILRLDPNTGDGVPSNPFFDSANPRSAKSRVWALGLRNPCRMTLRPGTGSHNPADANPGVLCLGDVGMDSWEELSICTGPGQNLGWPIYEGLSFHDQYGNANIANLDAPNPLFGQGGCTQQHFYFRNLLIQDTQNPNPSFPNPCNPGVQIPSNIPKFVHRRPEIDWGHGTGPARTGIFVSGNPTNVNIGAANSPISGPQFAGNASIGGVWYTGTQFPASYQGAYFHADWGSRWIKVITFDQNHKAVSVQNFLSDGDPPIQLAVNPTNGDLYYARWERVMRVRYIGTGNFPPSAAASADVHYGPSPLTVQFSSAGSSDPETPANALQYHWDFGNGQTSNQPNPSHTFTAASGAPVQFNVTLTVTDGGNLSSQASLIVSVNNTPPIVSIVSPVDGSTYSMGSQTQYWLTANISDAEHGPGQLLCQWLTVLHHNDHTHVEPMDFNCQTMTTISPVGCETENTYFYRIKLTVTDAAGLTGSDQVDLIADCTGNLLPIAQNDSAEVARGGTVEISVLSNDSDPNGSLNPQTVAIVQPPVHGTAQANSSGQIVYTHNGSSSDNDQLRYTVNDNAGGTSNAAIVNIVVVESSIGDLNADGVVNVDDLVMLLAAWGPCTKSCVADIAPQPNGDGHVNVDDLVLLLANWG